MKRFFVGIGLIGMVFAGVVPAAEQPQDNVVYGMADKGTHGLVNIATGWFEFPMQIYKGYENGIPSLNRYPSLGRSLGASAGVIRGVFHAVGRTAWGVVQLAGFWSANPTENTPYLPLLDAEYAWQMGARKTVVTPDLDQGLNRIQARIGRGFKNTFCGLAEFPGQIYKADMERRVPLGVLKGFWYALSRELYGVADLGLFLFPIPEENLGVPFDEVEPWDALQGNYYNNVQ